MIGKYVAAGQRWVPGTEAPIRDIRSPSGWHIAVSSFLTRDEESSAALRVRFLDKGVLQLTALKQAASRQKQLTA